MQTDPQLMCPSVAAW